jgi:hypothetical protein
MKPEAVVKTAEFHSCGVERRLWLTRDILARPATDERLSQAPYRRTRRQLSCRRLSQSYTAVQQYFWPVLLRGDILKRQAVRGAGMALAISLVAAWSAPAAADSICGPGKQLASNAWACIPETSVSRSNSSNNTAAAIGAAAGILGIVGALAGQLTPTDNVGQASLDTKDAGNASRMMNRSGFLNMQKGNFSRAATAFKLAAESARKAQNWDEATQNDKNWSIAVAHGHLQAAVKAETKGDVRAASKSYHAAIVMAQTIGDNDLVQQLQRHNDDLVSKAKKAGKGKETIPTGSQCANINGVLRCQ